LRYWGVEDVRLLNGGWVGWGKGKHPVETVEATPVSAKFVAKARAGLATKDDLLKSLDGGALQIVDARAGGEFCGIDKLNNKRAGAIPGAKQLEWIDLLDRDTHRFKGPGELRVCSIGSSGPLPRLPFEPEPLGPAHLGGAEPAEHVADGGQLHHGRG
jgi:thiosulfate/3-mercaptopyruvate sulfurtransferase